MIEQSATSPDGAGSAADESVRAGVFDRQRPHLLAVAFRILGADADAQDVVQEAWLRYARADVEAVRNVQAWLTTVVSRLCLDLLRRSRESPRRPEDLPERPEGGVDPADFAVLAGELTAAFAIVLDELTPAQRVAFVLHDVFGAPFDEIGDILGTTAGSAKKLASRARGRLHRAQPPDPGARVEPDEARRVVGAFLAAAQRGDLDGLVLVLHPQVIRTADPQALAVGARQRARGAAAVIAETGGQRDRVQRARLVSIDGRPGIAVWSDRQLRTALVFRIAGGCIVHYDVIADPQRLALLRVER